jgi:hypothetical protein
MARQRTPGPPPDDLTALLTAQVQQQVVQGLLRLNPTAVGALAQDPLRQAAENNRTLQAGINLLRRRAELLSSVRGQDTLRQEIRLTRELGRERERFTQQIARAREAERRAGLGRFGRAREAVTGAAGAVGGALGGFDRDVVAVGAVAQSAFAGMFSLVEAWNPATVERFERATRDLMAVLGRDLAPVVEAVTDRVRALADTVATLDPEQRKLITTVGELAVVAAAAAVAMRGLADDVRCQLESVRTPAARGRGEAA